MRRRRGSRSASRANTGSRDPASAEPKSSWRCSAAPRNWSTRMAGRALRAGERAFARAGAAPSYAYVFNSAAWDEFDRWSEARRDERLGVSAQYLPDERPPLLRVLRPVRLVASGTDVRLRLVSARRGRLAAVLPRPLGASPSVWLDLDRRRSLGVADASLRALGILRRRVVLDSRTHLGPGVGLLGVRAWLRELVSARLEQPAGVQIRELPLRRPALRPVVCVDGRPASAFRPRPRQRQRSFTSTASTRASAIVRRRGYGARSADSPCRAQPPNARRRRPIVRTRVATTGSTTGVARRAWDPAIAAKRHRTLRSAAGASAQPS